jgi:hypothetical protein
MRAKFIYENLNFERGLDPKVAMGIGDINVRAKKLLQPYIDILKEIKKEHKNLLIKHIHFYDKDGEEVFTDIKDFYVEFEYGRSPQFCSIGLKNDNDIPIEYNYSKNEIYKLILNHLSHMLIH